MVDLLNHAARSALMARIRSADTAPEWFVRKFLHRAGHRYRLHARDLPGRPDIVLPKYATCIFVNGCFWHAHAGCAYARLPKTHTAAWSDKLRKNVARDRRSRRALLAAGWRVIDIWECGIKDVSDPDLSWLPSLIEAEGAGRVVWPKRPRKPKPAARKSRRR